MTDNTNMHWDAAIAMLFFMSILFTVAGLVKLLGIVEVELGFFDYSVTSRAGIMLWVFTSLLFTFLFGYLLRIRLKKK
jgi:hypothetical protein